jgi:hypothetical protein
VTHNYWIVCGWFALFLAACGAVAQEAQLPTAHIRLAPTLGRVVVRFPARAASPTIAPAQAPAQTTPIVSSTLDQYRVWMEEARGLHPYPDSVDAMWQVMICESSGEAAQVADAYAGLFQYDGATWAGDWNPYRDQPILDPHAQIFATAKAWHDGNQGWWGCYGR